MATAPWVMLPGASSFTGFFVPLLLNSDIEFHHRFSAPGLCKLWVSFKQTGTLA
jgi:hypothetical protein